MKYILKTDGGARGNPGPAGIGAVIEDETGEVLETISEYLGKKTNNQAEYSAVIEGLKKCKDMGASVVHVLADSELLVRQANGEYKVKNDGLKPLFSEMKRLEAEIGAVHYEHVRREKNKMADKLANEAMDRGSKK